jgi:hypothetical protein
MFGQADRRLRPVGELSCDIEDLAIELGIRDRK